MTLLEKLPEHPRHPESCYVALRKALLAAKNEIIFLAFERYKRQVRANKRYGETNSKMQMELRDLRGRVEELSRTLELLKDQSEKLIEKHTHDAKTIKELESLLKAANERATEAESEVLKYIHSNEN
jgi:TolA-binding protein